MDQDQYLSNRVDDQIKWYDTKSKSNQYKFKFAKGIEILCAAVIPFLAGMGDTIVYSNYFIGILGIIIAFSAGILALNKYQENWIMFRSTCEALRHEKFLFLKQKTAYEIKECDWSSDVCSSDLDRSSCLNWGTPWAACPARRVRVASAIAVLRRLIA